MRKKHRYLLFYWYLKVTSTYCTLVHASSSSLCEYAHFISIELHLEVHFSKHGTPNLNGYVCLIPGYPSHGYWTAKHPDFGKDKEFFCCDESGVKILFFFSLLSLWASTFENLLSPSQKSLPGNVPAVMHTRHLFNDSSAHTC